MGWNKTYKHLSGHFTSLGRRVAKSPSWFIAVPVFISLLLGTGIQRIKSKYDVEYFLTRDNSEVRSIRDLIESMFPMDVNSDFDLGRYTRPGRFAIAMFKAKDGGSLLREEVAKEVIQLINTINKVTIESEFQAYSYEDLCVRNEGKCYVNDIVSLYKEYNGTFSFKYPVEIDRHYGFKFYGNWMSGVNVSKAGIANSVKVARLIYFLDKTNPMKEPYTSQWLRKFMKDLKSVDFKFITVLTFVSKSLEYELQNTFHKAFPYLIVASVLVMAFSISTCIVPNSIQGKPWTGVTTVIGCALATLSGFGLLAYFGVPYLYYNILIPFLVLGVSMDDTFVFLAAWRRTDPKKSVEERLGETYSESSVAISLTSLTNVVSFAIGATMTPYTSVRAFCTMTSCCLFFDYIYQITFVGACLALLGCAEKENLHCFTMIPVKSPNSDGPHGYVQKFLYCTGHYAVELKETSFLLTLWDRFGVYLAKISTKIIVLVTFGIYFSVGLWNACSLSTGIQLKDMAFYDSPTYKVIQDMDENFQQYLERIQIIIPTPIDYSNPKTYQTLQQIFNEIESTDFLCDSSMAESWLRSFHQFLDDPRYSAITSNYNKTNKNDFITMLRGFFLRHPLAKRFQKDIFFNENHTEILASRFLFQTNYTKDLNTFNAMWWKFQKLSTSFPIPILVFHRFAYFYEGFKMIIPVTLQTIAAATLAVAVISYVFLCSLKSTLCVTFCILSIVIGVLGYMNLWGVNVNIVSMTIIMLVSGFSVDYSSHIACSYMSATGSSSDKLRKSISDVGLPIFQAISTTLLCVSVFVIPPSYSFLVLMKVVFLLSVFAGLHALIFLPVFLCVLEDLFKYFSKTEKRKYKIKNGVIEKHAYVNHVVNLSRTELEKDSVLKRHYKLESVL